MFKEIEQKKRLLDSRKPFSAMTTEKIEKLDLFDFVYNNLSLDGSRLTQEGMSAILNGEIVRGVSIYEQTSGEIHRNLIKKFTNMRHMKTSIDLRELVGLYSILINKKNPKYRNNNPVLFQFNYKPPSRHDIPTLLAELFKSLFMTDYGPDFIRTAVDFHNGLIKIYPFEEGTEALARTILQYALYSNGYPLIYFGLSEQQYNDMVGTAIKKDTQDEFYNCILGAVNHKLDTILNYINNWV